MGAGVVCDADEGEHDGDFYEDSDDCCQCCSGLESEKGNCHGYGQFEEVAGAYHSCGCGYGMGQSPYASPTVGDEEYEDGL